LWNKSATCVLIEIPQLTCYFFDDVQIREEFSKHSRGKRTSPSTTASTAPQAHEDRRKNSSRFGRRENVMSEQQQLAQPASPLPRLQNLKAIMFSSPASSSRRDWQQETNDLLESIQRECNEVFERNKVRASSYSHRRGPTTTTTSSPRSTLLHVLVDENDNMNDDNDDGSSSQPSVVESSLSGGGSSAASASSQDLNRALDDTEALIQSLLG
jgi:hypothetical protein